MPVNPYEQEWPNTLQLNGSDYFQLLLDRHYRQHGLRGNVSRFAVKVKGRQDVQQLECSVNNSMMLRWLHSLRLERRLPFQLPQWKQVKQACPIPVSIYEVSDEDHDVPRYFFEMDIQPYIDPPFRLDLIYHRDIQTTFLFTWSHILMDAQGAEILLSHLGNVIQSNQIQFLAQKDEALPVTTQAQHARKVRDFMFNGQETDISLLVEKDGNRCANHYHLVRFSEVETEQIAARGQSLGLRLGRSPLLLAATMRSFHELLKRKGAINHNIYVPVPQNQRKKGVFGPVVSNQVSYLFYRLLPNHLEDMQTTVNAIGQQMIDQMRAGIPASFSIMMDLLRRFPLWLYSHIIKSPTKGTLASFFFSDTGKTLDDFKFFCGLPVKDAIHYPPNSNHPGFTVIFTGFQKKLQVMIAYTEATVTEEDLSIFEAALRKNLFG